MSRTIEHDGRGQLQIRFRFDRTLVDRIKTLPRRRWIALEKLWEVPEDDVVAAVDLLSPHGFRCDDAVVARYRAAGGSRELEATTTADAARTAAPEPPLLGLFDEPPSAPVERAGASDIECAPEDWCVSTLNAAVAEAIAHRFPAPIWIVGEISGWTKQRANRRYHGFELVERDEDGRELAKVSAMLWQDDRRVLERRLADAGDPFALDDEITVRVKVRVELFERWGLYRVRVQDIDVRWTLGEAARRREQIIRRLVEAGLAERNRALALPELPLRVGLITSVGSDAYNDVLRTLQESGFAFRVVAHGARVQGPSTEPSVLNALDRFRAMADELDVVVICRGGGSRTDLAWFDTEPLGRAVATFPLPVIVGIGHEQDSSVLDAVARRAKTPTAAAGVLVDRVRETGARIEGLATMVLDAVRASIRDSADRVSQNAKRLERAVRFRLDRARGDIEALRGRTVRAARGTIREGRRGLARVARAVPRAAQLRIATREADLERVARQLLAGARRDATEAARRIADFVGRLRPAVSRAIEHEAERLQSRETRMRLGDPRRVVERGYAILRGSGGVVTNTSQAPAGTRILADLRDGRLRLRSEGTESDG